MLYPVDWHYPPFVVKWSSNQHQIVTLLEPGHEVTSRLLLQISTGAVSIENHMTAIMRSVIRNCFPHIFVPLEFSARRLSKTGGMENASGGQTARHMGPASFTFSLLLMKERRWINCVRQGSTVMQIGNFTFETISSAEPLLWKLISFACEQRISYPGCQRLSCAVSGFGQASTCGRSRKFCRPVVDTEEAHRRMPPHAKTFSSRDRSELTFRFLFQRQTRILANWHEKPLHPTQPRRQSFSLLRKWEGATIFPKGKAPGKRLQPTGNQDGWCFAGNKIIPFENSKLN